MSYTPRFTDTAVMRMKKFSLQEWEVIRAFESSEKTYDGDTIISRANLSDKLVTAVYKKLDNGEYLILTCWCKDRKELDKNYRQRYGRWPKE